MNPDEFVQLAKEAGLLVDYGEWRVSGRRIALFAELVAAKEREACAKIADAELNPYPPEAPVTQYQSGIFTAAEHIAEAIRARNSR